MKEKMTSLSATAILFAAVAAVALFVWHSWYLYCGAVLTGYVALSLLTAILKHKVLTEPSSPELSMREKTRFYDIALDNFALVCLLNMFFILFAFRSAGWGFLMLFYNVATALGMFIGTLYWYERGKWRMLFVKVWWG